MGPNSTKSCYILAVGNLSTLLECLVAQENQAGICSNILPQCHWTETTRAYDLEVSRGRSKVAAQTGGRCNQMALWNLKIEGPIAMRNDWIIVIQCP